ncbi:MAG: transporter [Bacteroidota bacterium]
MKRLLTLMLMVFIFDVVNAQVQEELTPLELKQTTIVTQPATLKKGFLRSGFALSFSALDKFFDDDAKKRLFPDNIWAKSLSYQFAFQYGISDRLQASMSIPFRNEFVSQSLLLEVPLTGTSTISSWEIKGNGLSDIELGLIYQLVPENILRRAVLVSAFLTLPTGEKNPTNIVDEQNYTLPTGSGEGALNLDVTLRKVQYPFSYEGSLGYNIKFGGTKVIDVGEEPTDFKSGNLLTLRGAYNFHLNEWLVFQNDVFYFSFGDNEVDGQTEDVARWALQYVPRLSFQIKRFRINQAVSFVVKGRNSSADPGYTMVVQYVF